MKNHENTVAAAWKRHWDDRDDKLLVVDFTKCESCSKLARVLDTQIIESAVICNPCIDTANEFGDGELSDAT